MHIDRSIANLAHVGAQRLSGRVLDSRMRGRGFESHHRHCVVSLSKNINPSLVLVQPRKNHPYITERLLMVRKEPNQTKQNTPQGTKIVKYCTCPAGRVTYNFHSYCKHMHLFFKNVCNKGHKGVICNMTSSSSSFQSTRPVGRVLWEELLVLSRFNL